MGALDIDGLLEAIFDWTEDRYGTIAAWVVTVVLTLSVLAALIMILVVVL